MESNRRELIKGISICGAGFLLNAFAAGENVLGNELEEERGEKERQGSGCNGRPDA